MSGKWHISEAPAAGEWRDYPAVVAAVEATGFDRVASVYETNLGAESLQFSHNPDWMVATSLAEIDAAVVDETSFFLQVHSTVRLYIYIYTYIYICQTPPRGSDLFGIFIHFGNFGQIYP